MSRTISSDYTKRRIINYQARSPIRATDWRELARHQNLLWTRMVSDWGGHAFDPAFEASSTSYSATNSAGGRNLDQLSLGGRAIRITHSGNAILAVKIFGNEVDVQAVFTNQDTSTVLATVASTNISDYAEITTTESESDVQDGSGNPAMITIDLEAKLPSGGSPGKIWAVRAGESEITTTSKIPAS